MGPAILRRLRALERATRIVDPEVEAALARRWAELPERVRTPAQIVGRRMTGCEGTHGVFPRCNLACTPCYHSKDANRVRVDGPHTIAEVDRQLAHFRARRGPGQYAQLIGGEASLLDPDDHAAALERMWAHDRVPMSFTHGDVDYDYLVRLTVRPDGRPRFRLVSFAAHFDSTMLGRRGIERPTSERELNPFRAEWCAKFERLRREHGVRSYLAHNMTVTPANVGEVADVIRACRSMGFRLFSFQPAAFVGHQARWRGAYRALTDDDVWAEIERGAGSRLPYRAIQLGDLRCNRAVWGIDTGERFVPVLDDEDPRDLAARDAFFAAFPGNFLFVSRPLMAARVLRAALRRPSLAPTALGVGWRLARRTGLRPLLGGVRPMTFVMHNFMDAAVVGPAWELLREGRTSDDPAIRAAQERLEACAYSMAHPESDELVPACVQHAVLDPEANRALARLLPLHDRSAALDAAPEPTPAA
ncbi:MAG: radical SAM domain-containing protein [Thermoleophilia bacterium]